MLIRDIPEIAKIDTAKNKLYFTSSVRVLEIAIIGLSENLTHLPSGIFAKISRRKKFPIYGILNDTKYLSNGIQTVPASMQHFLVGLYKQPDQSAEQLREVIGIVGLGFITEGVQHGHGCPALGGGGRVGRGQQFLHDGPHPHIVHHGQHHVTAILQLL